MQRLFLCAWLAIAICLWCDTSRCRADAAFAPEGVSVVRAFASPVCSMLLPALNP